MADDELNWYSNSADFPEAARKRVPKSLLGMVDQGNAHFFSGFAKPLPKTYGVLQQLPAVRLMEEVTDRITGMGERVRDSVFSWALPLSDFRTLFIRIPAFAPESGVRQRSLAKFLPALPPEFSPFYERPDGMTISEHMSFTGTDFPLNFPDWRPISEYYPQRSFSEADPLTILDDLESDDARVVMTLRNGDFVLCNMQSDERVLSVVRRSQTDTALRVEDMGAFDTYFSACLSEPENTDIALQTSG